MSEQTTSSDLTKSAGKNSGKSSGKNSGLLPRWFWGVSLSLVFIFSVIWHLPISPLLKSTEKHLPGDLQNLSFDSSQGGLWEGETQLNWSFDNQSAGLDLGRVQWEQSPASLLGAISPMLKWQTQFGQWQGEIERAWMQEQVHFKTHAFQIDVNDFLMWLAPFARVPFEIQADVTSKKMDVSWSPSSLVTAIEGRLLVQNLSTMGISMPPLVVELSMPNATVQEIVWTISGQDAGWELQGKGVLKAKPNTADFGRYDGEIVVNAQSVEQMPDFAHLLPQPTPTQAKMTLRGNLKQLRMP